MLVINPVNAANPLFTVPDTAQEFQWQTMMCYQVYEINVTVPEGDSMHDDPDGNGWQIIKVRQGVTPVLDDAANLPESALLLDQHVREYQDERWYEGLAFDYFQDHVLIPNPMILLNNTYIVDKYLQGEAYTSSKLSEDYNFLDLFAEKTSGYRFKATFMSPHQSAIFYCNNRGYTLHDVLSASNQYITGLPGYAKANSILEIKGAPVEPDYNLSYSNPVLIINEPNMTGYADMPSMSLPIYEKQMLSYDVLNNDEWVQEDAFGVTAALVVMGVIYGVATIINYILDYLGDSALRADMEFWRNAYLLQSQQIPKIARDSYNDGVDDMTQMFEELLLRQAELLNLTRNQIDGLLGLLDQANTWTKGNYTNPYDILPWITPYDMPSQVTIDVAKVVITIVVVVIILVVIYFAWKLTRGKGKKDKDSDSGDGDQNITVIKASKNSLMEMFNFGMSTGAI